jgi:DHA1 family bicyclomycin/chloramphenicol resistance-like MFS transporter
MGGTSSHFLLSGAHSELRRGVRTPVITKDDAAETSKDSRTGLLVSVIIIYILTASGLDIFNPALSAIREHFKVSVGDLSLLLNAYFVGFSILAVAMGVIGDRYDKLRVITICLWIFIGGSIFTLVPYFPSLVAGRLLQGIGASAPVVLALVVLLENSQPAMHQALVGRVSAVIAIATCLAPVIGAAATDGFGWMGSFVLLVALALGALGLVKSYMPPSPGDSNVRLSLSSYFSLLRKDWLPGAFIVSLLRANYLAFLGFASIYYVSELGVSVVELGYHLGALALTFSIASVVTPRVSDRFGHSACVRFCLSASVVVMAAGVAYVRARGPEPIVITAIMAVISALVVMPNNILYPRVLSYRADMRGRAAALVHAFKMVFSAILVHAFALMYDQGMLAILTMLCFCYVGALAMYEYVRRTPPLTS